VPAVRDAFAFGHLAWDAQPADRTGRRDVVVVVVMVVAGRRDVVVVVVVVVAGRCDVIVVVIVVVAGRRDVVVIAAPWELHASFVPTAFGCSAWDARHTDHAGHPDVQRPAQSTRRASPTLSDQT
jgi:hypothetical protein